MIFVYKYLVTCDLLGVTEYHCCKGDWQQDSASCCICLLYRLWSGWRLCQRIRNLEQKWNLYGCLRWLSSIFFLVYFDRGMTPLSPPGSTNNPSKGIRFTDINRNFAKDDEVYFLITKAQLELPKSFVTR